MPKRREHNVGRLGDRYDQILIHEKNRATVYVWEHRPSEIEELKRYMQSNYISKGVRAVLYGVRRPMRGTPKFGTDVYYAVFVQDGFIVEVNPK